MVAGTCSTHFESRYGTTTECFCLSFSARNTRPRFKSDVLIAVASLSSWPATPDSLTRSVP